MTIATERSAQSASSPLRPHEVPADKDTNWPTTDILQQILQTLREIQQRLAGAHKPYYTVDEVAAMTGRSEYTVRRWISEQRITATRITGTGPRGRLLIARDQLDRLIASGMGAGVPDVITSP